MNEKLKQIRKAMSYLNCWSHDVIYDAIVQATILYTNFFDNHEFVNLSITFDYEGEYIIMHMGINDLIDKRCVSENSVLLDNSNFDRLIDILKTEPTLRQLYYKLPELN